MKLLANKRALIVGAINDHSIAYGIAKCMHREGAELAFTYQTEKLKERITKIATEFDSMITLPCDVTKDEEIKLVFTELAKRWDGFDILVHSVAYAPPEQLAGDYIDVINREGFKIAHDVSSYSLAALAKEALPLMKNGRDMNNHVSTGSIITVSHIGGIRTFPNYNVMGIAKASLEANVRYLAASLGKNNIRVNAISAGPIRTLSASGVKDIRKLISRNEQITPLKKNINLEEVGNAAVFLGSDWASGITGDILYVDAGFHIIGLPEIILQDN